MNYLAELEKKMMRRIFRYGISVLLLPVYYISCLIPKKNNIWIFGSWHGHKFADDSKYLFLYIKKNQLKIRPIWLTRNQKVLENLRGREYEAYKTFTIKGFLYSMRAGCVIVCCGLSDVNRFVIGKAQKILLWHGVPLKKQNYDRNNKTHYSKIYKFFKFLLKTRDKEFYNKVIAVSEESRANMSSAFRLKDSHIAIAGHSRNDALFDTNWLSPNKCDYLNSIRSKHNFKYVFTYLPTFRDSSNVDLFRKYGFKIDAFERMLDRSNAIFIAKAHHVDSKLELFTDEKILQRIYVTSDDELPDIYPLLRETNILITDYSSVYCDYLLLNRPIIFTPFDIDEYLKKDRELYYTYDEIIPGPKAKNWDEVIKYIEEAIKYPKKYEKERMAIRDKFNTYKDNKSSERAFKKIKELLEKSK